MPNALNIFQNTSVPHVFACPPGANFSEIVVTGLLNRLKNHPPEHLARTTIFTNARRSKRQLEEVFIQHSAGLLPHIRLITDLADDPKLNQTKSANPLRSRLELAQLVRGLIQAEPDLAPPSSAFDLAFSLAKLFEELQSEGINPDIFDRINTEDLSGHWQRSLKFLRLAHNFSAQNSRETLLRRATETLIQNWQKNPPEYPVLLIGSTGSRDTTNQLMRAIAKLESGAVILPGFDFETPPDIWDFLQSEKATDDHPQFRFTTFLKSLNIAPDRVTQWHESAQNPANALISLALRPAPVTDQWQSEGPKLTHLDKITAGLSLIEAKDTRTEALAVALAIRHAVENNQKVAVICPDRNITRQISAALDRWRIKADDSAGIPLNLTAPGRFLGHIAAFAGQTLTSANLAILLKHPLCHSGDGERGDHLRHSRDLEIELLRENPFPTEELLAKWMQKKPDREIWTRWLLSQIQALTTDLPQTVAACTKQITEIANGFANGPDSTNSQLWKEAAGEKAALTLANLIEADDFEAHISPAEFLSLFASVLANEEVRNPATTRSDVMIWGQLEARVQSTDVVVIAGLNEGIWPKTAEPDPWMNRAMRKSARLLLPERQIGLAAHDFQQAVGAKNVILSRSIRDEDSETVPSRWLNRLTNLLGGLPGSGIQALENMRARGNTYLHWAAKLNTAKPIPPALRPSPRPPVEARPKQLSVTTISTLIRDPYAIYARRILSLKPLPPFSAEASYMVRGILLHSVFENFIKNRPKNETHMEAKSRLLTLAQNTLQQHAPWPSARQIWLKNLTDIADDFLASEEARETVQNQQFIECNGDMHLPEIHFHLTGKADRIEMDPAGNIHLIDYKTGSIPSEKQQNRFDRQMFLEAMMIKHGAFESIPNKEVQTAIYLGIGSSFKEQQVGIQGKTQDTRAELVELITSYQNREQGYTSRRAVEKVDFDGDYDHLARFGEWGQDQAGHLEEVGDATQ